MTYINAKWIGPPGLNITTHKTTDSAYHAVWAEVDTQYIGENLLLMCQITMLDSQIHILGIRKASDSIESIDRTVCSVTLVKPCRFMH